MRNAMTIDKPKERFVGRVSTQVRLSNWDDELAARKGDLDAGAVRSMDLDDVLVDTGATNLCLPSRMVKRLGLTVVETVEVATAAGVREMNVVGMVRVQIDDRVNVFTCLEISDEAEVLVGVIPLEALGVNPNVHTQKLDFLPMDKHRSYITA